MAETKSQKEILGEGIMHPSARPMQVFIDKDGCMWICDKPVDPNKPLKDQACWNCKDLAFTRND